VGIHLRVHRRLRAGAHSLAESAGLIGVNLLRPKPAARVLQFLHHFHRSVATVDRKNASVAGIGN